MITFAHSPFEELSTKSLTPQLKTHIQLVQHDAGVIMGLTELGKFR